MSQQPSKESETSLLAALLRNPAIAEERNINFDRGKSFQDSSRHLVKEPPVWRDPKIRALARMVDKRLAGANPEKPQFSTATETTRAGANCPDKQSHECGYWTRLAKTTLIPVAVAALAGFVGGYNSRIPVEPEIRKAIPVQVEIRRAIPVPEAANANWIGARSRWRLSDRNWEYARFESWGEFDRETSRQITHRKSQKKQSELSP